jgi:uncharacterized protein YecA (UPF0149 family)
VLIDEVNIGDVVLQEIKEQFADGTESLTRLIGLENEALRAQFVKQELGAKERFDKGETIKTEVRQVRRIGRNDPCPCNSGIKFKKCCGINFAEDDERIT